MDGWLVAAVLAAAVAGPGGLLVPRLLRALPPHEVADAPAYDVVAARPGLAGRCAVVSGVVAALLAAAVAPDPWAVVLVALCPPGVALAVVDLRTRLLPKRLVLPATGAVVAAAVVLWALDPGTGDDLVRCGAGLVLARSAYWVLWWVRSAGLGFGDVRLAALAGAALGHRGWAELAVGLYAGFLVFGVPGALLALVRRDRALLRTAFPFGPFLLAGAVLGVLVGPAVVGALGGG